MQKQNLVILLLLISLTSLKSQYAPAADEEGTTAIHKDSSIFVGWAISCLVNRGYVKLSDTSFTYNEFNRATIGEPENGIGKADGGIVSLGDSGIAILSFEKPLGNGPGHDFAVFENGFQEVTPPQLYFLELALVEVSSDGEHFVRFPAKSHTPIFPQVGTFDQLNPENLYNLAGKYVVNYGTPFDLEELKDSSGLDVNAISHIKIIDVVGSIQSGIATLDSEGVPINDPFPTPFNSGGFDLDAVGVIHYQGDYPLFSATNHRIAFNMFPNPAVQGGSLTIRFDAQNIPNSYCSVSLINLSGQVIYQQEKVTESTLKFIIPAELEDGLYLVQVELADKLWTKKLIITR